jgi:Reverse transcriptase (RNA-dependent DNA polymerase)
MPFGLTNALATFQALINDILRKYLDRSVVAYLNDILIYSKNKTDHVRHVTEVLKTLKRSEIRIQSEKCVFHQPKVEFLGFILLIEEVKIDPFKVEAVQKWPRP